LIESEPSDTSRDQLQASANSLFAPQRNLGALSRESMTKGYRRRNSPMWRSQVPRRDYAYRRLWDY